jgi:hypothetical protein
MIVCLGETRGKSDLVLVEDHHVLKGILHHLDCVQRVEEVLHEHVLALEVHFVDLLEAKLHPNLNTETLSNQQIQLGCN